MSYLIMNPKDIFIMARPIQECLLKPKCSRAKTGYRTLVKRVFTKFIFLISQPKHMYWVLKRTVSMRRFF